MMPDEFKQMIKAMEIVERFLGMKGRFVGNMVHVSIKDLADLVEKMKRE